MSTKLQNYHFSQLDQAILRDGISELPTLDRQLLVYRFWGNCTIEEVAKEFHLTWMEVDQRIEKSFLYLKEYCLKNTFFSLSSSERKKVTIKERPICDD